MADTKLKVQIQFQATGDRELARAFKTAAIANEKLAKSVKKNEKLQDKLNKTSLLGVRNNRLLANSFATLRSKMLLASFAFTLVSGTVGKFIRTSADFEKVKVRLNAMFGSVDRGTQAFNTFNKIAATTPFTLQDVVEAGASLKAFGADSERLIKPVSDLAAFMGTTATEAAQALGRAFAGGAGAADILRERGILQLVKDSQGIEDLTKLTLPEFRKALEETITDPSVGVAGATDKLSKTLSGLFSNLADSFTRLMAALGDVAAGSAFRTGVSALTTLFGSMAESLKEINKSDVEKIAELRKELGLAAPEADKTGDALVDLLDAQEAIGKDKTLVQSTNDLKVAQQDLLNALLEKQRIDKENEKTFNKQSTERVRKDIINARARVKVAQQEISAFTRLGEAQDKFRKSILADAPDIDFTFAEGLKDTFSSKIFEEGLEPRLPSNFDAMLQILTDDIAEKVEKLDKEKLNRAYESFLEFEAAFQQQLVSGFMNSFNQILSLHKQNLDQRISNELKALRKTDKFRNASMEQRQTMEDDVRSKFAKEQKRIFKLQKALQISQVIIDTAKSINTLMQMALAASFIDPSAVPRAKALSVAMGAVSAAQIGLIAKQQAPEFARGGSFITAGEQFIKVGDNAGGRERVDITPLSTPDFGDAGGGGGINVNIMGNVIGTQEFVRDSLIPEIENSIRRNLA